MINPHLISPSYKKFADPRYPGGKLYFAYVGRLSRVGYRRASEAEAHAKRLRARWVRLYNAAITAQVQEQEPAL